MKKTAAYVFSKYYCMASELVFGRTLYALSARKSVRFEKKIRYSPDKRLYMNICVPTARTNENDKLPLFVYLHGGGFVSGAPEARKAIIANIAARGFFTVGIFYGLAPRYRFPSPIENIYAALGFLLRDAEKYGFDPERVYVGGDSAGATLAVSLGAISSNDKYKRFFSNLDKSAADLRFSGIAPICGLFDTHSALQSGYPYIKEYLCVYADKDADGLLNDGDSEYLSPIRFVNSDFPPAFVITGERDAFLREGKRLSEKLAALNVDNDGYHGAGASAVHAFPVCQLLKISKTAIEKMTDFFLNRD
ncbi:MAG: alpha/beta hydrolase [Clostridiales bacterium]|jgi:acetyl esterase/lipase|nr:alpha/beta hydrolase [Clostridiales bacterium]